MLAEWFTQGLEIDLWFGFQPMPAAARRIITLVTLKLDLGVAMLRLPLSQARNVRSVGVCA